MPDWPIHELFSHINPRVLEVDDDDSPVPWEAVGDQIRDALSLKRLKIWGRPVHDHASGYLEQRPALREIDNTYWQSAGFSYSFFDDTARGKPHTNVLPHSGLPEYTDLHVNRAEVLSIWAPQRRQENDSSIGRIPITEFIRMAEARGWRISGEHDLEKVDLLDGLRQAGIDDTIQYWGRLNRYGNRVLVDAEAYRPISQDHWHDYQFDWHSVSASGQNEDTSTYNFHAENRYLGGYVDILLDGDAAVRWLDSPEAFSFRGRRARQERERRSR